MVQPIKIIGEGCKSESFRFVGIHLDENLFLDHRIQHAYKINLCNYN